MKRIALVIGSYTEYDKLELCLKSINNGNRDKNITVIAINQGKNEHYRKKIESVFLTYCNHDDYYIRNSPPKNVYEFWNQGVDLSLKILKANVIGILNDDLILPKGSVVKIVDQLLKNKIQMIWPDWTSGRRPRNIDKANQRLMKAPDDLAIKNMAGFCFFCPAKVYKEIGLFDTRFNIYGGDTDFFYRFLEAGLVARQTNNVKIHHYYSASLNKVRDKVSDIIQKDKELTRELHKTVPKLI